MSQKGPETISKRQEQILSYIKSKIETQGYPPSVREIGRAVGLKSTSTVHGHLSQLEKKGYIRRDSSKPRAIEILPIAGVLPFNSTVTVPLIGQVTAGLPILAVENVEDYFPLPKEFGRQGTVFMLKVIGDSMIEAGILDGDYVIVRQQGNAENGEIIVALIEDEATIKRFFKEKDKVRLQPENRFMEPIIVENISIIGKVTGVFRRIQ